MQTGHLIKYTTIIKAPIEKVWQALTDPKLVEQYFFGTQQETDWKVGSPIAWSGEYEGKAYRDKGIVLEFIPNEKFSYSYLSSWNDYEDVPENYLHVTNEVKSVDGGTELTITQSNYDEERAKHSEQNWGLLIDEMKKLIE